MTINTGMRVKSNTLKGDHRNLAFKIKLLELNL